MGASIIAPIEAVLDPTSSSALTSSYPVQPPSVAAGMPP